MGATAVDRVPRARAVATAEHVVNLIRPACLRVEIAGSIRRRASDVQDVEIVALPRIRRDLAGAVLDDELEPLISRFVAADTFTWRRRNGETTRIATGPRFYALVHRHTGFAIDLFAVRPPAQWGAILAIRTGPAEYSQALVIGARRRGLRCEDGRLIRDNDDVPPVEYPTPEERQFIEACGFPWAEPEWRR